MASKLAFSPEERKRHEAWLLALLAERGPCFVYELEEELNLSPRRIGSLLRELFACGRVWWRTRWSREKDQTRRLWSLVDAKPERPKLRPGPRPNPEAIDPELPPALPPDLPSDPEHAAWMAYWQARREARLARAEGPHAV